MRTKAEIAAYHKKWAARNRDKTRASVRRWKDKNPKKVAAYRRRAYYKNHAENLASARGRTLRRRQEQRKWISKLKEESPCVDCGTHYPAVCMDFDHLPGKGKTGNVGRMPGKTNKEIRQEIEKCEIVCANCHRLRTWNRRRTK